MGKKQQPRIQNVLSALLKKMGLEPIAMAALHASGKDNLAQYAKIIETNYPVGSDRDRIVKGLAKLGLL